jgi:hypothetical protein
VFQGHRVETRCYERSGTPNQARAWFQGSELRWSRRQGSPRKETEQRKKETEQLTYLGIFSFPPTHEEYMGTMKSYPGAKRKSETAIDRKEVYRWKISRGLRASAWLKVSEKFKKQKILPEAV